MEPLFENKYVMTKSVLREFQWRLGHYLLIAVFMGVALVCAILTCIFGSKSTGTMLLFEIAVISVLLAAMFFFIVHTTFKRMTEQAGGQSLTSVYRFAEENFTIETIPAQSSATIDYSTVKKVVVTKNLIVLKTRARLGYILRRDSFTVGTEEAFMAFINSKIANNTK